MLRFRMVHVRRRCMCYPFKARRLAWGFLFGQSAWGIDLSVMCFKATQRQSKVAAKHRAPMCSSPALPGD